MPNQCRNCGRDVNNNYAPYQNAYATSASSTGGGGGSMVGGNGNGGSGGGGGGNRSALEKPKDGLSKMGMGSPQITAKVMFGTVGAIKELREKEQAEKNSGGGGVGGGRRH